MKKMSKKKRRKAKPAAHSSSWLADLLKDIAAGIITAAIIKLLKLD